MATFGGVNMRLCNVWIEYNNGEELNLEVWLDINGSIEDQIFKSFNPLDPDYPQITNFEWQISQE